MNMSQHGNPTRRSLQCMEVWGGNDRVDTSVGTFGLDTWVFSQPYGPAATHGGDVYYLSSCASGNITRLMLADVSGHGPDVSSVAGELRTLMRQNVNRISQKHLVKDLNNQFVRLTEVGCFATALVFSYFAPSRKLQISNAGHPPPLIFRAEHGRWSTLEDHGPHETDGLSNVPLGVQHATDYSSHATKMAPGDMVLCFSDALFELRSANQQQLGTQRLAEVINDLDANEPEALIPQLLRSLDSMTDGDIADAHDDMTILLFRAQPIRTLSVAARVVTTFASLLNPRSRIPGQTS